jgi:hypothetical protein
MDTFSAAFPAVNYVGKTPLSRHLEAKLRNFNHFILSLDPAISKYPSNPFFP